MEGKLILLMPRIILTATSDLSYDRRMQRIAGAFAEAGWEVLLLGRRLPSSEPLGQRPFAQKRLNCFFRKGKLFYLEFQTRLFLFLLFNRFDWGWAADLDTILPHWLLGKLRKYSWVYDAHEYFTEVPELQNRILSKRIWSWIARCCIPAADEVFTVGQALAGILSERYGRPFRVLRNVPERLLPVPEPRCSLSGRVILLYQGALNAGRGLPILLEAMTDLHEAELWLVGEGDLSSALRQMSEDLGLGDRVKFWGYVMPSDLPGLSLKADIGLDLLDASSLNYFYSLSNKSMDYLQAGLPSLEMDFPEYRLLHQEWGVYYLLSELKPATVVAAVRKLLADGALYERLSKQALRAAEKLHWEAEKAGFLSIFAERPENKY